MHARSPPILTIIGVQRADVIRLTAVSHCLGFLCCRSDSVEDAINDAHRYNIILATTNGTWTYTIMSKTYIYIDLVNGVVHSCYSTPSI